MTAPTTEHRTGGEQVVSILLILRNRPVGFHAAFIRAPVIEDIGPGIEVLARLSDATPVAARQGQLLATAFHSELTRDDRFHRFFLQRIAQQA